MTKHEKNYSLSRVRTIIIVDVCTNHKSSVVSYSNLNPRNRGREGETKSHRVTNFLVHSCVSMCARMQHNSRSFQCHLLLPRSKFTAPASPCTRRTRSNSRVAGSRHSLLGSRYSLNFQVSTNRRHSLLGSCGYVNVSSLTTHANDVVVDALANFYVVIVHGGSRFRFFFSVKTENCKEYSRLD